jgi:hypothetical protein
MASQAVDEKYRREEKRRNYETIHFFAESLNTLSNGQKKREFNYLLKSWTGILMALNTKFRRFSHGSDYFIWPYWNGRGILH